MGTGKKKIDIKKITKETCRMVTFSKRRKGLFKKAKELEFMTGSRVVSIVFSPTERPYTCEDVNYAIKRHFSNSNRCTKLSSSELNFHDSNSDIVVSGGSSGSRSLSTLKRNGLLDWVEGIDVEKCQNLNQLLLLKEQLEGTRKKMSSTEDAQMFEAMFA